MKLEVNQTKNTIFEQGKTQADTVAARLPADQIEEIVHRWNWYEDNIMNGGSHDKL